jgi:hypothetical protein
MKYELKRPCPKCPCRTDIKPYLRPGRVAELGGGEFACHCTTAPSADGEEMVETKDSQHCAGMLIMLEKMEQPHQMMRICERIGLYDPSQLDMDAPVYDSLDELVEACEEAEESAS